jgi:uncharacterized protein YeeX (DUF496 family)
MLTYKGKKLQDLTKEDLLIIIEEMVAQYEKRIEDLNKAISLRRRNN